VTVIVSLPLVKIRQFLLSAVNSENTTNFRTIHHTLSCFYFLLTEYFTLCRLLCNHTNFLSGDVFETVQMAALWVVTMWLHFDARVMHMHCWCLCICRSSSRRRGAWCCLLL